MAEAEGLSTTKRNTLTVELQTDLDATKRTAGSELDQYIQEKSNQHLLNLETIKGDLSTELRTEAQLSLTEQKAAVDAEFKAKQDDFCLNYQQV